LKGGILPERPQARPPGAQASGAIPFRRLSAIPALLLAVAVVSALYDTYRYPLRINDASTSSTYRDTPLGLQAGKYVALAVLALVLAVYVVRERRIFARPSRADILLATFGTYALARASIAALSTHSHSSLQVVLPFVCGVPFALVASCWAAAIPGRPARFLRAAVLFGAAVVVAHALVDSAEFTAWLTTGRLPALAEPHRLVRFGGIWDDPNGCAVFSALVATGVLGGACTAGRRISAIVLGASLLDLVLAWSISGWLVFGIGVIGVGVPRFGWRKVGAVLVPVGIVIGLVVGLAAAVGTSIGAGASAKLGSASERLHLSHHLVSAGNALGWLVGVGRPQHVEDAFGAWLGATGAIGLALFLAWLLATLWSLGRARGHWLLIAALGFVVASFFVPLFLVFPVGFFFLLTVSGARTGAAGQEVEPPLPSPARIEAS
jgi:hypothetical protein